MLENKDVRLVRTLMGLQQHELAKRVGVSASLISAIELGKRRLTNELGKRILNTLNLSDEDIYSINVVKAGMRV
jgi:transcriptional regulator with XRE-family HTH domain